jgi:hypothetical protein
MHIVLILLSIKIFNIARISYEYQMMSRIALLNQLCQLFYFFYRQICLQLHMRPYPRCYFHLTHITRNCSQNLAYKFVFEKV